MLLALPLALACADAEAEAEPDAEPVADADAAVAGDMAPCQTALGGSRPADGAEDVPLNAMFVLALTDPECEPTQWQLDLYLDGQDSPLQTSVADSSLGYLELVPAQPFYPGASYTLIVTDTVGYEITASYQITAGDSSYTPDDWQPTIENAAALWFESSAHLSIEADIGLPLGQSDYTLVRAGSVDAETGENPTWEASAFGFGGASTFATWLAFFDEDPGRACIAAEGRNLDGSWTETVVSCVATEVVIEDTGSVETTATRECGCDTGAALPGLAGAFSALALIFRRGAPRQTRLSPLRLRRRR